VKAMLPVLRADALDDEDRPQRWLIETLWSEAAVGLIGGQPKCLKSWLALEMAVSVATGTPCLARHAVQRPGPALIYLAEDALHTVRHRLGTLCHQRGKLLDDLDVHVITAPVLRLDLEPDQARLRETVRTLAPRLLVLDPLVRLHRLDENSSAEVSHFLAYLRALQREFDLAIALVHHTNKSGTHAAGQSLRGSGDFHAWSDSAIYLRRQREGQVLLAVEHRAAPVPPTMAMRLTDGDSPYLELVAHQPPSPDPLDQRILQALKDQAPRTRADLRQALAARNQSLGIALDRLLATGVVTRGTDGYTLAVPRSRVPPIGMNGNGTTAHLPAAPS